MSKHKLQALNDWKQRTWQGLLLTIIIEAGLAYGFASWSIDSGSLFLYAVTLLFILGVVRNLTKLILVFIHGQSKTTATRRTKK